jgi:hypothetical protein
MTKYDQIEEDEMGEACSAHGEMRNSYNILVGKPDGKRSLGRPRRFWEDNSKMDFQRNRVGECGLDSCGSG